MANAARAGTTRSSRGGNREVFQNPPPPDGPRTPSAALHPVPAADALADGSGRLVGGDTPGRTAWRDTVAPPASGTNAGPQRGKLCCNTAPEDARAKTAPGKARCPTTDYIRDSCDRWPQISPKASYLQEGWAWVPAKHPLSQQPQSLAGVFDQQATGILPVALLHKFNQVMDLGGMARLHNLLVGKVMVVISDRHFSQTADDLRPSPIKGASGSRTWGQKLFSDSVAPLDKFARTLL